MLSVYINVRNGRVPVSEMLYVRLREACSHGYHLRSNTTMIARRERDTNVRLNNCAIC